ncbi:TatD family hydrolase [Radiobacillus deserti]|uniref:TatD family deoxyribonuclease n=1 Tax=Radiobacillus deserti TaxID=2594883 RepID=A0A516KC69_9BACI|nr:TatD family hydrolase [Radiobacillus deserti]QDP38998.1 TatD family deoxyribonuclease [Radiobacillus deserti]
MKPIMDAHIHLDMYKQKEQETILQEMESYKVEALIAVSYSLLSCKRNLELHKMDPRIKVAYGHHPEQDLPSRKNQEELERFLLSNSGTMVAIGEIGLPYYNMQKTNPSLSLDPYVHFLERMIVIASQIKKPVVLHAVYDHAPIVCDLLEKHNSKQAHFHWFKGDAKTVERMIENGYHVSFTPDCLYEPEIQELIQRYPIEQMMVETDGPWGFKGPFANQMTHPKMIHAVIEQIATLKKLPVDDVYQQIYLNTKMFYAL